MGELGWELYVSPEYAVHAYDAIVGRAQTSASGSPATTLDSLRIEKGFVHVGHDVGPTDDPFTAGLGHVVKLDRRFLGADAARAAKDVPRPIAS